jgi:hypothetical protein
MASFDIDKLTLECFVNRNTYHKYLAKKDPATFLENKHWRDQLLENHDPLLNTISQFIHNPQSIPDETTRDIFHRFMVECLDFLYKQNNALDNTNTDDGNSNSSSMKNQEYKDEEDTIFSHCEQLHIEPTNPIEYWKMQKVWKQNNTK